MSAILPIPAAPGIRRRDSSTGGAGGDYGEAHGGKREVGQKQELADSIMTSMKTCIETERIKYSPSSQAGKAFTYAYTRRDNMMRYPKDGRLRLDNNLAEDASRPVALEK